MTKHKPSLSDDQGDATHTRTWQATNAAYQVTNYPDGTRIEAIFGGIGQRYLQRSQTTTSPAGEVERWVDCQGETVTRAHIAGPKLGALIPG